MTAVEDFRHERLKLSGDFMRLLQVQGGTKKDMISLRITQYATKRRPNYAAISYTWGPNPKAANTSRSPAASTKGPDPHIRLIRVNGRHFRIRINLWNLLWHLRERGESRFLWVDALCIDQENLEERNFHVQRMSKIYEHAEKTFVWLGLPSEDLRQVRVLEFIHQMAQSCPKPQQQQQQQAPDAGSGARMFRDKYLTEALSQRWTNVLEVCRATYWTRTWIIQEFIQASQVEVLCGAAKLDLQDFEDVVRTIRSLTTETATSTGLPSFVQQFIQTIPFRLTSRRIAHTASTLEDLLSEFYDSKCAERRDKIYGILGIADDCAGRGEPTSTDGEQPATESSPGLLQPDYSKPILEIYFEVVKYLTHSLQPRAKSPMQGIYLAQRALGITQADVESYMALLAIHTPSQGNGEALLDQRLVELACPLVPDYVNFVQEVLPGWTSIRDLRQRLDHVDWTKYVGLEVRRKTSSRPSAPSHRSSTTFTTSTSGGSGTGHVRAPLPPDLIDNIINTASHSDEILHLYNYSASPSSSPPSLPPPAAHCTIPTTHALLHTHDKRVHNNPTLLKPSIIIESNPSTGIDPVRVGFACTEVRAGDLICQFLRAGRHPHRAAHRLRPRSGAGGVWRRCARTGYWAKGPCMPVVGGMSMESGRAWFMTRAVGLGIRMGGR